jgi:hypothetical protein
VASSAAPLDLHFRESAVPSSVRSDDGPGWRRPDTLPQLIDSEDLPQQPAIKGWLLLKDDEEHAKRGFDGAGFTIEVELD